MAVFPSFGIFDRAATQVREHLSSAMISLAYMAIPWVYEAVLGRPAPGSAGLAPYHDHTPEHGGRPIPRGGICSADVGNRNWGAMYTHTINTAYTWEDVAAGDGRGTNGPLHAYFSPGLTGFVEVHIGVRQGASNAGTVKVRMANTTASWRTQYSSAVPLSGAAGSFEWVHIGDVPGDPGIVNTLGVQAYSDAAGDVVEILAVVLAETQGASLPSTTGVLPSAAPRGL